MTATRAPRSSKKEALKTSEVFIAGVMLRFGGGVNAYPVCFARKIPEGKEVLVLLPIPVVGIFSGGSGLVNTLPLYG